MNKYRTFLLIICMPILFIACNPFNKDAYLNEFDSFVEDVESNCKDYSAEDWESADKNFAMYTDDYYEAFSEELTKEDQKQIGRLTARYYKLRMASAMDEYGRQLSTGANIAAGFMEELERNGDGIDWDAAADDVEELFDEID